METLNINNQGQEVVDASKTSLARKLGFSWAGVMLGIFILFRFSPWGGCNNPGCWLYLYFLVNACLIFTVSMIMLGFKKGSKANFVKLCFITLFGTIFISVLGYLYFRYVT